MFYTEEIKLNQAAELLRLCGLTLPAAVDYTAGVFTGSGKLAACGSLKGNMRQGVAVDPAFQGEDLSATVLTHLLSRGREKGIRSLYLFTKPEKAAQFAGLGFRTVVKARPYAALLEWGEDGIDQYTKQLAEIRANACKDAEKAAALVINGNPFTKGHRYLVRHAAERRSHVYILAVEEDLSLFSFADRLAMMKAGTADLSNVTVIPGGRYVVSALTFPSYFTKEEQLADAHAAVDAELFACHIAPALAVDQRFLGTEPLSPVTQVYNRVLAERLPKRGIAVTEIPRISEGDAPISASRVRRMIKQIWEEKGTLAELACSENKSQLEALLPDTTIEHILQPAVLQKLERTFYLAEERNRE